MKIRTLLTIIAASAGVLLLFGACNTTKGGYEGLNKIYLTADNPVIEESGSEALVVGVDLTTSLSEDVSLDFALLNDEKGVLSLEDNPVTIKAGSKSASFKVVSNGKGLLITDTYFKIGLPELPCENMALDAELSVRVTPDPQVPSLSETQLALIEGYKSKYGVDLTNFLGIVSCHTEVVSPAGGYTTPFAEEFTRIFDGKTVITLGEASTADTPVLEMLSNPMGLTEYLFWVLRQETVENDEFWYGEYAGPDYADIMTLLGWNKENPGVLSMSLSGLSLKDISSQSSTVEFVSEETDEWGDTKSTIAFDYVFTPWELQKKLMAEGNKKAIELNASSGSADPERYLMISSVAEDDYGDELNFVSPEGRIDFSSGTMTFKFVFDHYLAGGYTRASVTYAKK